MTKVELLLVLRDRCHNTFTLLHRQPPPCHGSIQFANGSTLGSHPSLAHDANTNITSIQILKSVDALLDTANITTANIGTLFATTMVVGSTEATGATFEDLSITNGLTVGKNITVTGNLTVEGTTTTVSSSTLDVADLNITVAKGAADSAAADGAGLTVDGASATFLYAHDGTKWVVNKPFSAHLCWRLLSSSH